MGSLRKEEDKEEKNATGGKRTNRSNGSSRIPLLSVCMSVVAARSTVILIACTEKKRASKKERKKERKKGKKKERRERVQIHIAIQYIGQLRPMADIHVCKEHHLVKR
jgi:hypothetical protein